MEYRKIGTWWRLVWAGVFALTPLRASAAAEPKVEAVLRSIGMEEAKAKQFAAACEKAEETESIESLRPFLEEPQPTIVLLTALFLFEMDPLAARAMVRTKLEANKEARAPLLMALCFDYARENVDYLIKRLPSENGKTEQDAIQFSLRTVTQQQLAGADAWNQWWKAKGKGFRIKRPTLEQQQRRMQAAAVQSEDLREALSKLKGLMAGTKGMEKITGIFDQYATAVDEGREMKITKAAMAGDAYFATSRFDEAAKANARSLKKQPEDERTHFLQACLLFESGKIAEASHEFADLAQNNDKAGAARFLHRLCERRLKDASEPLLRASLEELFAEPRPEEVGLHGWGEDPIMNQLFAQGLTGAGVAQLNQQSIAQAVVEHAGDEQAAIGLTLLTKPFLKERLQGLLEKFPQSRLIVALLLQESSKTNSKVAETLGWAEKLKVLDPTNSLPHYLAVYAATYQKRSIEDIRAQKLFPLPPESLVALTVANALPRFDLYAAQVDAAKRRAWQVLAYPWKIHVDGFDYVSPWLDLSRRVQHSANAELQAGNLDRALEICEVLDRMGDRIAGGGGFMQAATRSAILQMSSSIQQKSYEAKGNPERGMEVKARSEKAKAEFQSEMDVGFQALSTLPIPSLTTLFYERMQADEGAFYREAAQVRRDAKARTAPAGAAESK